MADAEGPAVPATVASPRKDGESVVGVVSGAPAVPAPAAGAQIGATSPANRAGSPHGPVKRTADEAALNVPVASSMASPVTSSVANGSTPGGATDTRGQADADEDSTEVVSAAKRRAVDTQSSPAPVPAVASSPAATASTSASAAATPSDSGAQTAKPTGFAAFSTSSPFASFAKSAGGATGFGSLKTSSATGFGGFAAAAAASGSAGGFGASGFGSTNSASSIFSQKAAPISGKPAGGAAAGAASGTKPSAGEGGDSGDEGSGPEDNPEYEPPITQGAISLPAAEKMTNGEENEETVVQLRVRLHVLEKSATGSSKWVERGTGPLRIKKRTVQAKNSDNSETKESATYRIVMRRENTPGGIGTKLLLNLPLSKGLPHQEPASKCLVLSGLDAEGALASYLIQTSRDAEAKELMAAVKKILE